MYYFVFFGQIFLSFLLGGLIGWQRERSGKEAGVRTFSLVTVGSALFTILSLHSFGNDMSRVAAQILTGIGFIGAGTIINKKGHIEGLTTAACMWVSAAVGMAVGAGWYWESVIATMVIFGILLFPEKKLFE